MCIAGVFATEKWVLAAGLWTKERAAFLEVNVPTGKVRGQVLKSGRLFVLDKKLYACIKNLFSLISPCSTLVSKNSSEPGLS